MDQSDAHGAQRGAGAGGCGTERSEALDSPSAARPVKVAGRTAGWRRVSVVCGSEGRIGGLQTFLGLNGADALGDHHSLWPSVDDQVGSRAH